MRHPSLSGRRRRFAAALLSLLLPLGAAAQEATEPEIHGLIGVPVQERAGEGADPKGFIVLDIDENVAGDGTVDEAELMRRNPGQAGDVEILVPYPAVPEPGVVAGDLGWPKGAQESPWWPETPESGAEGPDLAVQKTAPWPCTQGQPCRNVVVLTNAGSAPYSGPVRVVDVPPAGWALSGAGPAGSGWNCVAFGGQVICDRAQIELAPGAQDVLVLDLAVPGSTGPGQVENCATVEHDASDANAANDRACTAILLGDPDSPFDPKSDPAATRDLVLTKTAGAQICQAGVSCPFTLTIANEGDEAFDGTLSFVDIMPDGWSHASGPAGWWCLLTAGGGSRVGCWQDLRLEPGQSVTAALALRPPLAATGAAQNCAEIDWRGTGGDNIPGNDGDCASVEVTAPQVAGNLDGVDLAISKRFDVPAPTGPTASAAAPCVVGDPCQVRFAVQITNEGTKDYFGSLIFDDLLPLGWTYAGMTGAAICETLNDALLSCGFGAPRNLAPGESVQATVTLRTGAFDKAAEFVLRNCAGLSWPGATDANPANDTACDEMTFQVLDEATGDGQGFVILKEADETCLYNLGPCEFRVGIRNVSGSDFDGGIFLSDRWLADWSATMPTGWNCSHPEPDLWRCGAFELIPAGETLWTTWAFYAPPDFNPGGEPLERENCAWALGGKACVTVSLQTGRKTDPTTGQGQTVGSGESEEPPEPTGIGVVSGPEGGAWDLGIEKSAPHADMAGAEGTAAIHVCGVGQDCHFTVKIRNQGVDPFKGLFQFRDTAPPGWRFAGIDKGWSCTPEDARAFTCAGHVELAAGAETVLDLALENTDGILAQPVQQENCVRIAWGDLEPDFNDANTESCLPFILANMAPVGPGEVAPPPPEPGITMRKSGLESCEPGKRCDFVIVVEGTGEVPFTKQISVNDIPPKGWTLAGAKPISGSQGLVEKGRWVCNQSDKESVFCQYDIVDNPQYPAEGFTKSDRVGFGVEFDVPADALEGEVKNCAILDIVANEEGVINESVFACADVYVAHKPRLTINKIAESRDCVPDQPCDFTVVVKNEGKGRFEGMLAFEDNLETEGDLIHGDVTLDILQNGVCDDLRPDVENFVQCATRMTLLPGESIAIPLRGQVSKAQAALSGTLENCASLRLLDSDPDALNFASRNDLVRDLLLLEDHLDPDVAGLPGEPLNVYEKLALVVYKKKNKVLGKDGKPDVSEEITDAVLGAILPKVRDRAFDGPISERNADGSITLEACAKVDLHPGLTIAKNGPFLHEKITPEVVTPEMIGGGPPKIGEEDHCGFGDDCTFLIQISSETGSSYANPLMVEDRLPEGWRVSGFDFTQDWFCQGVGTNVFRCVYKQGQTPVDLSQPIPLLIHAFAPVYNAREVPLTNCAYLMMKRGGGFAKSGVPDHEACVDFIFRHRDYNYGAKSFAMSATGTESCTPPDECSFYEFTARRGDEPDAPYAGPLTFTVTPPPETDFDDLRVTRSPPACPASAWSCDQAGPEFRGMFTCKATDCAMAPGDEVAIRIDGKVAPFMSRPPERPIEKTACGALEWEARPGAVEIEQQLSNPVARACFTTTIKARSKCETGFERNAAGQCVRIPRALDLAVSKRTAGNCEGQATCRFAITVENATGAAHDGRIVLRDRFDTPGARLRGSSGPVNCGQVGEAVECVSRVGLAAGARLRFELDLALPRRGGSRSGQNCASLVPPPEPGAAPLTRNDIRLLQLVLKARGFDPGPADGLIGPRTRSAAEAALKAMGREPGAEIDRDMLALMMGGTAPARDTNPANDRACVSVTLPGCGPGYSAASGTGACYCPAPRVERDGACILPAKPTPEPTPPLRCDGGNLVGGSCICPPGYSLERLRNNAGFRCTRPQTETLPPMRCDGGNLIGGSCVCPQGYAPERLSNNAGFRCTRVTPEPEPVPMRCDGGALIRGICICPPAHTLEALPNNAGFRCKPPQVIPAEPVPTPPTCPQGQVYSHQAGRCIPKPGQQNQIPLQVIPNLIPNLEMIPLPCPPGQVLNPRTGTCVLSGVKID